jgi:hypothetical protein
MKDALQRPDAPALALANVDRIVTVFLENLGMPGLQTAAMLPLICMHIIHSTRCPHGVEVLEALIDIFKSLVAGWAGDAHVRVATACLHCTQAAFVGCGPLLERHLDRLLPPLLLRAADGKEGIRRAAAEALAAVSSAPISCVRLCWGQDAAAQKCGRPTVRLNSCYMCHFPGS